MTQWLKRKDYEEAFFQLNSKGKQIWVNSVVKQLPYEIQMTLRLADLDFIKYARIRSEPLEASSENYPNRPKAPIINMHHETTEGVQILYSLSHKYNSFFDICSPIKGCGNKIVEAIVLKF